MTSLACVTSHAFEVAGEGVWVVGELCHPEAPPTETKKVTNQRGSFIGKSFKFSFINFELKQQGLGTLHVRWYFLN